jgi:hypothetical protein
MKKRWVEMIPVIAGVGKNLKNATENNVEEARQ